MMKDRNSNMLPIKITSLASSLNLNLLNIVIYIISSPSYYTQYSLGEIPYISDSARVRELTRV